MYNTEDVTPGADELGRRVRAGAERGGEPLRRERHGVRLPDLHRGRGRLPDDAPARSGDHRPLRAHRGAAERRGRAPAGAVDADRQVLGVLRDRDRRVRRRQHGRRHGVAGEPQLRRARRAGRGGRADRRHDRVGGHVDDVLERARTRTACSSGWTTRWARTCRPRPPSTTAPRRATRRRARSSASRSTTQFDFGDAVDTVRYGYCGDAEFLESLWLWRTPQTPTDYSIWVQKWTEIRGA